MPRGKVRFRVEAGEEGDMRIGSRSGLFGPSPLEITMFSYPTDEICTQKIMLCLSQEEQVEPSRASAERPSLFGGQGSPGTQGLFGRSGLLRGQDYAERPDLSRRPGPPPGRSGLFGRPGNS